MKNILLLLFLLTIGHTLLGQSETGYQKKLEKMFVLIGTEETFKVAVTQMMSMFKMEKSNVPPEVWERVENNFLNASMEELTVMLVPVYQKYLTESDLEEIIAFYESPVGKKYASKTPEIVQESMVIGQEWGMQINAKLIKELEEEGY